MARRTKPRSEVKTIYIGLRVEPWLRYKLEEIARKTDTTFTQIIRRALKKYVEKLEKGEEVAA